MVYSLYPAAYLSREYIALQKPSTDQPLGFVLCMNESTKWMCYCREKQNIYNYAMKFTTHASSRPDERQLTTKTDWRGALSCIRLSFALLSSCCLWRHSRHSIYIIQMLCSAFEHDVVVVWRDAQPDPTPSSRQLLWYMLAGRNSPPHSFS